jgi:hypothetical protein
MAAEPPPYEHLPSYEHLSLEFIWDNDDPINSNILSDDGQLMYRAHTSWKNAHRVTMITRPDGELVATLEWHYIKPASLTYRSRTTAIDEWLPVLNPLTALVGLLLHARASTSLVILSGHGYTRVLTVGGTSGLTCGFPQVESSHVPLASRSTRSTHSQLFEPETDLIVAESCPATKAGHIAPMRMRLQVFPCASAFAEDVLQGTLSSPPSWRR